LELEQNAMRKVRVRLKKIRAVVHLYMKWIDSGREWSNVIFTSLKVIAVK